MKKLFAILLCALLLACAALPVAAGTRKEVFEYADSVLPEDYNTYHEWADHILNFYDLTSEEWDQVMDITKDLVAAFSVDRGQSVHSYTKAQRMAAMDALERFCALTGSTYKMVDASPDDPDKEPGMWHVGDVKVYLYRADGVPVALIDGDLHKLPWYPIPTGETAVSPIVWIVASAAVLALAGASFIVIRRRSANVA